MSDKARLFTAEVLRSRSERLALLEAAMARAIQTIKEKPLQLPPFEVLNILEKALKEKSEP